MTEQPAVTLQNLSFSWPDGTAVLDDLTAAFGSQRTGLIGRNGTGKTTLVRLIAGELQPTSGTLTTIGRVGYLPQGHSRSNTSIADALGISGVLQARAAIEDGSIDQTHFDVLEGRWDLPERAIAALANIGLPHGPRDLERSATALSGGEWTLTCLLGVLLSDPEVVLLDEPSNDLDATGRGHLRDLLDQWSGPLIMISHDRDLLEHVDAIAELRRASLTMYGGTYTNYLAAKDNEQQAADRAVRDAEEQLRRERRQQADAQVALTRRLRYANTDHANKRRPKVVMNERKRQAQVSAGKYRILHEGKVDEARQELSEAQLRAQRDDQVRVELPDTQVAAHKVILTIEDERTGATLAVRGPERIALTGPNGSGKTTLLNLIAGKHLADARSNLIVTGPTVPYAYLDQHLAGLDPAETILQHVRRTAQERTDNDIRAQLARFLIRGDRATQHIHELSGGERFRVALAARLLATPPPQLVMLDEPTNNLDLASITELTQALDAYRGALIVSSHDHHFLDDLRIARTWVCHEPASIPSEHRP